MLQSLGVESVPLTVIVDRLGNIGFIRRGSFLSPEGVAEAIEPFLGDDCTETATLPEILRDDDTRAFPVPAAAPQAYILHIVDQDGAPVPGVLVNFCTDTACTLQQSDANGTVSFSGEPDLYHVKLLMAPNGFSFDTAFELNTDRVCGEWILRIRRDQTP